jgi:predicted pPIWI-associating nuclease
MNAFEWEQWRALQEFDRVRRREQMMGVDLNALMRQRDFLGSHSAAREALNELSRNPSHRWAMQGALTSPMTEAARAANLSAIEMVKKSRVPIDLANWEKLSLGWHERLRLIEGPADRALKNALDAHVSYVAEMSVLAESALARFAWEDLGSTLRIPGSLLTGLRSQVLDFTKSYGGLMDSLSQSQSLVWAMPPSASELSAQEFFLASRFVESISVEAHEDELEEESEEVERQIAIVLEDELQAMLARLDAGLVNMIKGAREALHSTNADRVRHLITSYRELNMHVLHLLSPDRAVEEWSTSPDDFANGRPTRKARLKFICRNINQGAFDDFVDKDIEMMVQVFDFLNKGTHEITTNFTESQLRALKVKAESSVQFMLAISQV